MRDLDQIQRWMQAVIMNLDSARAGVASEEARRLIDVAPDQVEDVVSRSKALSGLERLVRSAEHTAATGSEVTITPSSIAPTDENAADLPAAPPPAIT